MSNPKKDYQIAELTLQCDKLSKMVKILSANSTLTQEELNEIASKFDDAETKEELNDLYYKIIFKKKQFAVYEKVPAHQGEENGVILAPYYTFEDAQKAREKFGYNNDNYYIGKLEYEK